jgi:hypothetical protein
MLQTLFLTLLVFAAPSVYGSSYRFDISVQELSSSQPLFSFSKSMFAPPRWTTSKVELNSFLVVSKRGSDWDYKNPMWAFELRPGAALEVDKIKYGVVPPDFTETTAAKPLVQGEQYLVLAFGLGSSGSKEFILNQKMRSSQMEGSGK